MGIVSGEIQFHGIGINGATPSRAMLLHPRHDFSSPRRISRWPSVTRNSANGWCWRESLVVTRKIGSQNLVVRLMVHKR
jgi:hypothetical protein